MRFTHVHTHQNDPYFQSLTRFSADKVVGGGHPTADTEMGVKIGATVWQYLPHLDICTPCVPTISFLGYGEKCVCSWALGDVHSIVKRRQNLETTHMPSFVNFHAREWSSQGNERNSTDVRICMNLIDIPHRELRRWLSGKESACWASLVAQLVTNLPAMRETWVHSLGWEDPTLGGRSFPGEGKGYPLQYSGLENSMDCVVHEVKNKRIHLLMQEMQETWVWSLGGEDPLEKEMATHSRILSWEIPGTEESGGLRSMGSQRVRHNWAYTHTET